jgi:nitric oxide reductase subunit C
MVVKLYLALFLFTVFLIYTAVVYTSGTDGPSVVMNSKAVNGKLLYQKYNCTACHQLYGLGGYLGPELTTVMAQHGREDYVRAILKSGTQRMPNFDLNNNEIDNLIEFFKYVNSTAVTYKK